MRRRELIVDPPSGVVFPVTSPVVTPEIPVLTNPFETAAFWHDFARDRNLSGRRGPALTYTRTDNVGTYFDASGTLRTAITNEPRFDHDPATGQSLGLLIEESRTNYLLHSEDMSNASWTKTNIIPSTSPNTFAGGGAVAQRLTVDTAELTTNINREIPGIGTGERHVVSIYFRKDAFAHQWWRFMYYDGGANQVRVWIDFNNAVFGASGVHEAGTATGVGSSTPKHVGNDWYHVWIAGTVSLSSQLWQLSPQAGDGLTSYAGVSGYGDVAAPMFESVIGSDLQFPTSYIATTTTAVTRAADVCNTTSVSWLDDTQYTIYANWVSGSDTVYYLVEIKADLSNRTDVTVDSLAAPRAPSVVNGGASQANIDAGTVTANSENKMAAAVKANDFAGTANGGAVVTDTSGTLWTGVTEIEIGRTDAGPRELNCHIKAVAIWNERKPDAFLQSITT